MAEQTLTQRGAATRQRLLQAATDELVQREGALEVASVAQRAGVSVGLLYRYFGSKAGLVGAIVDDYYDRFLAEMARARDTTHNQTWAERERLRTELSVAFHYRDPLALIIVGRLSRDPDVAAVESRRIARLVEDAARNIERGQRRGEIPEDLDPRTIGAMLIGGFRVVLGEALTRPQRPPAERLVDELWRFLVAGVRFRVPEPETEPETPSA